MKSTVASDAPVVSVLVSSVAAELQRHDARWGTQYGDKGVVWQDKGGLRCLCGHDMPRDVNTPYRPWAAYYGHVAEAVLAVTVFTESRA